MKTLGHGTCGTCKFSTPGTDNAGKLNFTQRFCRWGPPIPMMLPGPQGPVFKAIWPTLSPADGCWRHEYPVQSEPLLLGEHKAQAEGKPS
jgi:hypothetical protein